MNNLNIPSYNSLISREHQIRALQNLYNYTNNITNVAGNKEVEINGSKNNHIILQNRVYTRITGLTDLTSDTTLTFSFADAINGMQNFYEGSFDTGSDITASGKRITIKWSSNINWGTSDISIAANTHYEFSIRREGNSLYGVMHSWSLS